MQAGLWACPGRGSKSYSTMSADGKKEPPPYIIPVQGQGDGVKVYNLHTPFTPPTSQSNSTSVATPVYTSGGGGPGSGLESGDGKRRFVSYDSALGNSSGMTTCSSCQQQVMTNVTYKAGTYAWLMCLLFICCGIIRQLQQDPYRFRHSAVPV
ncbi:hypothetical protein L3Q82_002817 [Scortum barcoo]|uniref:Uncharacterized protein n=1 Tax=Scortum barcoo TaxID=214431 RepID=A0ACB8VV85_9TELE|nr:hypothetical protein L3Q82_002817 [Scortum barcoo]